jgi:hypothetical protein
VRPLTKIKKLSGAGLHRNWVTIPHVTHQEEADITELEAFRKEMNEEAKKQGFRLTLIAFLLKASVAALKQFPDFNASLDRSRENLILKKYFNIGVAAAFFALRSRRADSFRVPEQLLPYLLRYLREIRPVLLGCSEYDGFWASPRLPSLTAGRLYAIVRARITARFGKAMCLHDFRRAAPTFLAMEAPEKIGLIPGVLQHASPEVGEKHYNLARSVQAGRRFAKHLADARSRLRPLANSR